MEQTLYRWRWPFYTGLGLLLLYLITPYLIKVPVPDESTFLYEGLRIARGELPYRDFFEFILPGTLYVVAGVIKVFGVSLTGFRIVALLAVLVCMGITLYFSRRFLSWGWRLALALFLTLLHFPLSIEVQHHLFSTTTGMLAIFCIWQFLNRGPKRQLWLLVGSLLAGVTVLFTQSLGGFLGLSLLAFLLIYRCYGEAHSFRKAAVFVITRYVLPAAVPVVLLFGAFGMAGAIDDLWNSSVGWLFKGGYASTTSHWYFLDGFTKFVSYSPVFMRRLDLTLFVILLAAGGGLPVLGLLWPMEYGYRLRKASTQLADKDWRLLLLWLAGVAFLLSTFSYPHVRLIYLQSWIAFLLAWIALFNLFKQKMVVQHILAILGGLFFAVYLFLQLEKTEGMLTAPRVESYGTAEKKLVMEADPQFIQYFNQMITIIRQHTPNGEPIFVYNLAPEFYLLADRPNPTRYQLVLALYHPPERIQEVADALKAKKPPIILYNHFDAINFRHDKRFQAVKDRDFRLYPIETVLKAEYQPLLQMENYLVFTHIP